MRFLSRPRNCSILPTIRSRTQRVRFGPLPDAVVEKLLIGAGTAPDDAKAVAKLARELPDGAHVYAPFLPSAVVLEVAASRGVQVFFDPRNDCYPADVFLAAADVQHDDAGDRLLIVRGTDHAILPEPSPLAHTLLGSPLWAAQETSGAWRLFRRPGAASPRNVP